MSKEMFSNKITNWRGKTALDLRSQADKPLPETIVGKLRAQEEKELLGIHEDPHLAENYTNSMSQYMGEIFDFDAMAGLVPHEKPSTLKLLLEQLDKKVSLATSNSEGKQITGVTEASVNNEVKAEVARILQHAPENVLIGGSLLLVGFVISRISPEVAVKIRRLVDRMPIALRLTFLFGVLVVMLTACGANATTGTTEMPSATQPRSAETVPAESSTASVVETEAPTSAPTEIPKSKLSIALENQFVNNPYFEEQKTKLAKSSEAWGNWLANDYRAISQTVANDSKSHYVFDNGMPAIKVDKAEYGTGFWWPIFDAKNNPLFNSIEGAMKSIADFYPNLEIRNKDGKPLKLSKIPKEDLDIVMGSGTALNKLIYTPTGEVIMKVDATSFQWQPSFEGYVVPPTAKPTVMPTPINPIATATSVAHIDRPSGVIGLNAKLDPAQTLAIANEAMTDPKVLDSLTEGQAGAVREKVKELTVGQIDQMAKKAITENVLPANLEAMGKDFAVSLFQRIKELNPPNPIYMPEPGNPDKIWVYVPDAKALELLPKEYQKSLVPAKYDSMRKEKKWLVVNKTDLVTILANEPFTRAITPDKLAPVVGDQYYDPSTKQWMTIPKNTLGWNILSSAQLNNPEIAKYNLNQESKWQTMILAGDKPDYMVLNASTERGGEKVFSIFRFLTIETDKNGNKHVKYEYNRIQLTFNGTIKSVNDPAGKPYTDAIFAMSSNWKKNHVVPGGLYLVEVGNKQSVDPVTYKYSPQGLVGLDYDGTQEASEKISDSAPNLNPFVETVVLLSPEQ